MKKFIALLLTAIMTLSLVACGAKSPDANESNESTELSGKVTIAHHRTDLEPELNELIAKFNEKYPNVEVVLEIVADYQNVMGIRAAGGELPDVFELHEDTIPRANWKDYCLPLNDSALNGKVVANEYFENDGTVYALNSAATYFAMMYNKTLYAQAGISEVPTTWDEFEVALQKLKDIGVIPFTTQYKTNWAVGFWMDVVAQGRLTNGGFDFNDVIVNSEDKFTNEYILTTMEKARELVDKGLVDPDLMSSDWDLQSADFAAGNIGTYLTGSFANGTMVSLGMDDSEIGFFAIPAISEGEQPFVMSANDRGYAVNKDSKNPEAAVALAEFMCEYSADAFNSVTPVIGNECIIPGITELLATNPLVVGQIAKSAEFAEINTVACIDFGEVYQQCMIANNVKDCLKGYNDIWNNAAASIGK